MAGGRGDGSDSGAERGRQAANFGLIGAAGYIAPRHVQAIHDSGNQLVAAVDPHDCVGYLDNHFPGARFFTEIERFDRFLEKLRRGPPAAHVHYVSICSPNYLHDAHVRLALRVKAHAICEKPLVISPWNLDALQQIEAECDRRVFTIFQLRQLPALARLKHRLASGTPRERAEVCLTYITRRGRWYDVSWKGCQEKSGGVAMNIGIHLFDLLIWLFGKPELSEVHLRARDKMAGYLELPGARVRWFLSTDARDLPPATRDAGQHAFRSITVDGQQLEFSSGFADLHTQVYREILAGRGTGIEDARPSIELVYTLNQLESVQHSWNYHPLVSATSTAVAGFKVAA